MAPAKRRASHPWRADRLNRCGERRHARPAGVLRIHGGSIRSARSYFFNVDKGVSVWLVPVQLLQGMHALLSSGNLGESPRTPHQTPLETPQAHAAGGVVSPLSDFSAALAELAPLTPVPIPAATRSDAAADGVCVWICDECACRNISTSSVCANARCGAARRCAYGHPTLHAHAHVLAQLLCVWCVGRGGGGGGFMPGGADGHGRVLRCATRRCAARAQLRPARGPASR